MAHLQYAQRYAISMLLKAGNGINKIGAMLERSPSVVSREIKRNSSPKTQLYNARPAQARAEERKSNRSYARRLTADIIRLIEDRLSMDYSPEQIVGYARKEGLACVSVTTIYKYIREDKDNKESGKQLYNFVVIQGGT